MKETLGRYLNYVGDAFGEAWKCDFARGVICGLAVYFALVLLVHLIFVICRRRKKCTSVAIVEPEGRIVVSLKAVTGALRARLTEFTQLEISEIAVYLRKEGHVFEIRGRFRPGASGARELYTALAAAAKSRMGEIFGLDNIIQVDLRIDACEEKAVADHPERAGNASEGELLDADL